MSLNRKTIVGFPRNTFILICFLTILMAVLSWFRLFYHPLQPSTVVPASSTTLESKLSKIPKPSLPENIIRPLIIASVSLNIHPNLPSSASLLSASPSSLLKDIAQQIALKLKLSQTKITPPDLTWKNNLTTLIANTADQSLSYFLNSTPQTANSVSIPDSTKSAAIAENFLKSLGLWQSNLSLNSGATIFLKTDGLSLAPVRYPQNASLIQISYQYQIDNLPIIISTQENPISLQVINNAQVSSFVAYPLSITATKAGTYPSVTPDKISSLVQNQVARLIDLQPQDYINPPASTEISSFSINSVQTAYYFSPTQNLLYPAYLIKGEGKFVNSTKANLTFLLSAIDPRYYK